MSSWPRRAIFWRPQKIMHSTMDFRICRFLATALLYAVDREHKMSGSFPSCTLRYLSAASTESSWTPFFRWDPARTNASVSKTSLHPNLTQSVCSLFISFTIWSYSVMCLHIDINISKPFLLRLPICLERLLQSVRGVETRIFVLHSAGANKRHGAQ